jgi:hypothetical protein
MQKKNHKRVYIFLFFLYLENFFIIQKKNKKQKNKMGKQTESQSSSSKPYTKKSQKNVSKKIKPEKVKWSKEKETKEAQLCLSSYKNQFGKPLYVATDPNTKYFRYIPVEEYVKDNLANRHVDDFRVYVYADDRKIFCDTLVSGSVKNMGREYFGYATSVNEISWLHKNENGDEEQMQFPPENQFVCWCDELFEAYDKWKIYCNKKMALLEKNNK